MSRARDLSKLGNPNVIKADTANNVGFGTQTPLDPANSGNTNIVSAGIVTAAKFFGDGSGLDGVASAGLGTAVDDTKDSIGQNIYYTNQELSIYENTTVNAPATSDVAYTQYSQVTVEDGKELIVADGDTFIPDVLGIGTGLQAVAAGAGNGLFGTVYVDNIENVAGRGGPNLPLGMTVSGIATFSGNVSIGGTLTYEDVTNVDSVGVVTARRGVDITAGGLDITAGGINVAAGGAKITGVTTVTGTDDTDNFVVDVNNTHFAVHTDGTDGEVSLRAKDASGNNYSKYMTFFTHPSGSAATERLRIGSAGQIGLGGANYGTTGQLLTSQGASAAPQWADAPAAGWNIITRGSTSSSAQSFVVTTDAITSTYEFYHLMFTTGGADHHAAIDITQDGTTWVSAAGGTQYSCAHSGQWQGTAINGQNTSNTYGYIYGNPSSSNSMEWYNAEVFFHGAHRTDCRKQFNCRFTYLQSSGETGGTGQSLVLKRDSNAAFTGIRIYTNNNISRAEWCLLGMKLS